MEQAITEGLQYRILVVDDEPDTARLAREWLDSGAFQILEASDGERGLELPVTDLVRQAYETLVEQGRGDLDHNAVWLELRRRNGLDDG